MSRLFRFFKVNLINNRRNTLILVMTFLAALMLSRLFYLQIVKGEDYQSNYQLKIERQETIFATRGNIYDRNGELLAYNKLANTVTIEDTGAYISDAQKNEIINNNLYDIVTHLEKNGDSVYMDFGIILDDGGEFIFRDEGVAVNRFRADVFGRTNISDLKFNSRININEASATAEEIMNYLCNTRYDIPDEYDNAMKLKLANIRYRMGLNSYQKYISTVVASDISEQSMAYIMENKSSYNGVDIEQRSLRVYDQAECFSDILGYTGPISTEEYETLSLENDSYSLNDIIGKSGLEQYMNDELMGEKGYRIVYVDSLGNLLETAKKVDQKSGNDIYLSIDKNLTIKTYYLLEQQIAGILSSKIANIKQFDGLKRSEGEDIIIPIYDVYYALIDNKVIDITKKTGLSDNEIGMYNTFEGKFNSVLETFGAQLHSLSSVPYDELPEEYQDYSTYLVKKLKALGVFDEKKILANDETQILWTSEKLSVNDYLRFVIDQEWIDIAGFVDDNQYVDTTQIYNNLIDYALEVLRNDNDFKRDVYYYCLIEDRINPITLINILYDQGVLVGDEESRVSLNEGKISPYNYLRNKIRSLEITPGQLGLDPCSGSCVIMDTNTGELLALVSYPGYDTNRLANNFDNAYYNYLYTNKSTPMYNHATQEKTAPGSTFKMVSATAGVCEGVINSGTLIEDEGVFKKVSNEPKCWIYPGKHGKINLEHAIGESCNCYFYEVGYRLAGDGNYSDERGIETINRYARAFGLSEKTGIEIEESTSQLASEYPVMAAIGQSDNSITTVSLARYVTAVANNGNVFDLTLISKIVDKSGNEVGTFAPTVKNNVSDLSSDGWNAIHAGMRLMVTEHSAFENFPIDVAGKTGTAQQAYDRPNHALFVGYAPYYSPEISIATRIPFGYTSANAAEVSKRILAEYFNVGDYNENAGASDITTTNRVTD